MRIRAFSGKILFAVGLLVATLFVSGCGSEEPPKYYERELALMRKQERVKELAELEKKEVVRDGYPWRTGIQKQDDPCLPVRIKVLEKRIESEIKYLDNTVHGRQSSKLRYRD